jgi:long-chain acyl-CoA synthetase
MNFADSILHHALIRPEKAAIILADRVVTYGMMAQGILLVTDRLSALRLAPGALVAVAIESPIRHLIVAAALCCLGHPILSARRTSDIPSLGLPIALFLEGAREGLVPGVNQMLVEEDWFTGPPRRLDATPSRGFAGGDAICRIELSSGTTGQPKSFSWSVDAQYQHILNLYIIIGPTDWGRMLCLPALSNNWGFTVAIHALYSGKTLCFAATARDTLHMIAIHNLDCLIASTQHVRELVEQQRQNPVPCPSLRVVFMGGSLPSRALVTEARASLCPTIVVGYGSTEASVTTFATADRVMATEGAVGFVAPWAEVQAVDEAGQILSRDTDTDGILRIRSNWMARPYPETVSRSDESFRDGWFYPGDRGRITPDGLLIVSGRVSEIINAGGARLAPETIEEIVRGHPAVADIAAFAGIGAGGVAEVWLAIVPRAAFDASEIVALCAGKGVPVNRVVTVKTIPRTELGKIERERLKRELGTETNR